MIGGVLIIFSGILAYIVVPRYIQAALPITSLKPKAEKIDMRIVWVQVFEFDQISIILCSLIVVYDTSNSLAAKNGLPLINAITSWTILGSCIAIPVIDRFAHSPHYLRRLVIIYLAFAPIFTLLSVR